MKSIEGKTYIEAKVHMLPTEDRGYSIAIAFGSEIGGKLYYFGSNSGKHKTDKPQHLYITTDEEPKIGDWSINLNSPYKHKELCRIDNEIELERYVNKKGNHCRKIIATTDPKLIADGVAEIEQSFIEEYCKAVVEFIKWYNENK